MRRAGIKRRLVLTYLLLLLPALGVLVWYASARSRTFYLETEAEDLEVRARLLADRLTPLLATGDGAGAARLQSLVRRLGRDAGMRITVIRPDGVVAADSHEEPARMDNHGGRPEVMEALDGRVGSSIRFSFTVREELLYVALPLGAPGAVKGVLRTALPLTRLNRSVRTLRLEIAGGGLVVALFAAAAGVFVARRVARPLEVLREGAERFAEGELALRLPREGTRETAVLAASMNRMARSLDERIRTVVKQRNEMEAVLSSMMEGVLAVDGEERILRLNRAAAALIGEKDPAGAEGRMVQEVIRNAALQRFLERAMTGEESVEAVLMLGRDLDRCVQAHCTALVDEEGMRMGVLVVLNDVTRLRELENIRRDFVANVSHELKTPITAIKGYVETLLEGAREDPEKARSFLEVVARHADRLNAIIEDLLSLSRIEQRAEKGDVSLEARDPCTVLESALKTCERAAAERGIRLSLQCPGGVRVALNPRLLEQAVVNLLDNAVKYSPPGTAVGVEAEAAADEFRIHVRDEGPGIAAEHLPRIFERFYRVDRARSRERGGTGLGLAIVKHIVQVHGGRVSVESTPGKGSRFTLHLPVAGEG